MGFPTSSRRLGYIAASVLGAPERLERRDRVPLNGRRLCRAASDARTDAKNGGIILWSAHAAHIDPKTVLVIAIDTDWPLRPSQFSELSCLTFHNLGLADETPIRPFTTVHNLGR